MQGSILTFVRKIFYVQLKKCYIFLLFKFLKGIKVMIYRTFAVFCACAVGTVVAQTDPGGTDDYRDRSAFEQSSETNPFAISLHNSNYILPYTHSSDVTNPVITVPGFPPQDINQTELSFQLSFKLPLFSSLFPDDTRLFFGYTQLTFWQLYTHDPFIRETNYQPELFITHELDACQKISLGLNHESNGRGGFFERSWNRLYLNYHINLTPNFWFSAQPWIIVFKGSSSNEHNPDIGHFLGHDQFILGFNWDNFSANLQLSNIESGFKRGSRELNVGYRLWDKWHLFGQVFSGYGRSLIEYNHSVTGFGLGLALNV